MFGYVRPRKDELKLRDYDRYQAAYCGLCRELGKGYGLLSRFFVNYDMTFLYFLLAGLVPEEKTCKCVCPANVFCRKTCYEGSCEMETVAAITVILCHYKLRDNTLDKGFFPSLPYRFAALVTNRGHRKAAKRMPQFESLACIQLGKLKRLEQECSASLDATADAFAQILCGCVLQYAEPEIRRPLEQILYHVGRFLYLTDALDDLSADCRKNNYNPLRYRFQLKDGGLSAEDEKYLISLLDNSVSLAGAALELLPLRSGRAILENIIYLGLPCVLKAVTTGQFRSQAKL